MGVDVVIRGPGRSILRVVPVLLGSAAFGLGLLAQPVLSQLLDSTLSQPDKLLLAVSMGIGALVLTAVYALFLVQHVATRRFDDAVNMIRSIDRKAGLRVEFARHGDPAAPSDPYAVVIRLLNEAESEILVLDHRPVRNAVRFGSRSSLKDSARRMYYDLFTKRATELLPTGRYLRYRRVVQLEEGPTSTWDASTNGDLIFAEHVQQLVAYRQKESQYPSAIKTSSVFMPNQSIIIVDGRLVLLEVAIRGPDGHARIQGDLLFHDPEGQLAGPLRELLEYIDAQATLVVNVEKRKSVTAKMD